MRLAATSAFLGVVTASAATLALQGTGRRPSFGGMLIVELPYWLLWAALTPIVVRVVRVVSQPGWSAWTRAAVHFLAAAALMTLHTVALYLVQRSLGMQFGPTMAESIAILGRWRLVSNVLAYGAIVGIVVATDATNAAREREQVAARLSADLARAQLEALRLQLNPHFLFNALNTAAMLVRQTRGEQSIRVLAGLSDLLRSVLAHNEPEVTLRDELDLLERYLAIERIRFGDRLQVSREVEADTLDAAIPSLLLQPIVENAIHHGVALSAHTGSLVIAAHRRNAQLVVEVCNDGLASDEADLTTRGLGIGIRNTIERLAHLYGDAFGFDLARTDRGTIATVTLPLRFRSAAS